MSPLTLLALQCPQSTWVLLCRWTKVILHEVCFIMKYSVALVKFLKHVSKESWQHSVKENVAAVSS